MVLMPRVLMVASEATPFAKTGGLADVLGALPAALRSNAYDAAVVIPRYASVPLDNARRVWDRMQVQVGAHGWLYDIYAVEERGATFYLADCPSLFNRPGLYNEGGVDYPDNHLRFASFSRAALGVARVLFAPDILHLHDWQAALCAPYLRTRFQLDPTLMGLRIVFTVHNLEHQGKFAAYQFRDFGLDSWLFAPSYFEFFGDVNLMKGAIVFSDAVTTVSPRYAEEIQTPEFGFGLDGLLRTQSRKLTGILNGVDYADWNPETDPLIAANYSASDFTGKQECKSDLLSALSLPMENMQRPVIGIVSRLARQKGFDLVAEIAAELLNTEDVCLAVLGSGEPRYEAMFDGLASAFPARVGLQLGYNNVLAHRIEAGSDMFLMPSVFEPCGLNQMYSLRYGTIPIVRATGGLDDTVDGETGFKFWGYSAWDLLECIRVALREYRDEPAAWTARMRRGMAKDYSWTASARRYAELYDSLLVR
jgi:starch synthase